MRQRLLSRSLKICKIFCNCSQPLTSTFFMTLEALAPSLSIILCEGSLFCERMTKYMINYLTVSIIFVVLEIYCVWNITSMQLFSTKSVTLFHKLQNVQDVIFLPASIPWNPIYKCNRPIFQQTLYINLPVHLSMSFFFFPLYGSKGRVSNAFRLRNTSPLLYIRFEVTTE